MVKWKCKRAVAVIAAICFLGMQFWGIDVRAQESVNQQNVETGCLDCGYRKQ